MKWTDLFINKPVLSLVVSALVLVFGFKAIGSLPVSQYPKTQNAVVTITTNYYGADAQTMAGFITQPLEQAIAQVQGIDYLSSSSVSGLSIITATLKLNYDSNSALTQIQTQISSVRNQLPPQALQPVLTVQMGQTTDAMYMGFASIDIPNNSVTDYLLREVKPKFDAVDGVQNAELIGGRKFALRAWLNREKMAGLGVAADDVYNALSANNYLSAVGTTKGDMVSVDLMANTDLHTVEEFRKLVIKSDGVNLVHLDQVATVTLGSEDYNTNVAFSGKQSVFVGIQVAPQANLLDVVDRVRKLLPGIQKQLPVGMTGQIVYDSTQFITSSIDEVVKTLFEALIIVTIVIYLFLGSYRAVAIPVIAMPLSLIGTFFLMQVLGYSINLLTLLALVLAIGLVVDDAIIVVENVDRHMKEGKSPFDAAIIAARELGSPILAMTVVLIAVYIPIGFQGGLTGALFTEFAFTLASSVAVSGLIALTLSPMMCSRIFKAEQETSEFALKIDRVFEKIHHAYESTLRSLLRTWQVIIVMGVILLGGVAYLYSTSKAELAPIEDQGIVLMNLTGPPNSTVAQMQLYADQVFDIAKTEPEFAASFQITSPGTGFGGINLKDYSQRSRSAMTLQQVLQNKWNSIAGVRIAAFQFPALPGSQGLPVQFVIKTTEPYQALNDVSQAVLDKARRSGNFFFVDTDLKIDKPQDMLVVDKDKVASLGMTQQQVGSALTAALGGGYVNYFSIAGRSYRVIPQVEQVNRLNPDQILDYYIRTPKGSLIQVRTFATIKQQVVPESINHFQQLNSATISGVSTPFVSEGEVLKFLADTLKEVAPSGYSVDYAGPSRQFANESGGFLGTMFFAILIVFLVLAAQFESFRDPIVILVSVPLALFGALIFINLGFTTLNIYTQVGLVTLMGLISKHGILIVEFANELQIAGRTKLEAIIEAATVRLRPILMTTFAMVLGVFPLVIASGAGAAGRKSMGLVIFTGLSIGTLFTLFVVPAMYLFIGADHHHQQHTDPETTT
ncbi:MMPL family transporter [Polynucleobacter paneuropaeus]|nr:MMPL family transporter [Polynucleobacter paneuropaeus]MBT8615689.1 MMPL family transporter [Polynucleobacter paneuropaeus]MBT8617571.1 MMPL family transporter [Polynucleobacter paneuropaeus]MBT8619451.1 MMPL family transporter [Polynucleobacter paneuropaeus]MBT8624986.1 MMPL family transporter [Polynucleobacter paneuropaeus]